MAARLINKKKALAVLSLTVLPVALCSMRLIGCGGSDGDENTAPPVNISFERQAVSIERFAQDKLTVIGDADGVSFSSSDESVVTVNDDGVITGVGAGRAVVKAEVEGGSAQATVTVKRNKSYPVFIVDDTVKVPVNFGYDLMPKLTYKGIELDANFGYTSSDSGLTVTNGVVNGATVGEYTCNVYCDYAGERFAQDVTISVGSNDYLFIVAPTCEISLCDVFGQGLETEITLTARTNASETVVWSSDNEDVLTVTNGRVTAISAGTATVTAHCGELVDSITLTVNKAELIAETPVDYEKSGTYIDIDLTECTGNASFAFLKSDLTVTSDQAQSALPVSAANGKTVRLMAGAAPLGEQILSFETHDFVIKINAVVASKIINTADDFMSIEQAFRGGSNAQQNPDKFRDGYFILNADIDLQGNIFGVDQRGGDSSFFRRESHELGTDCKETAARVQYGWYGVLDGRGHVVSHVKSGKRGLFGTVEKNSEIKNVAFVNAEMSFTSGMGGENSGFIAEMVIGKIDNMLLVLDNIPVTLDGRNVWGKAGVSTYIYGEMKNSIVIVTRSQWIPTEDGFATPNLVAVTLDGSPVDDLPVGSLTNTHVLSHGNLSVVGYIRNGRPSRYSKVDNFSSLLQRVDINEFDSFWTFTQSGLTFGSYTIANETFEFDL